MDLEVLDFLLRKAPEVYEKSISFSSDTKKYSDWYDCRKYFLDQNDLFLTELEKELKAKFPKYSNKQELFLMQKLYLMYPEHPPTKLLSLPWEHIQVLLGLCDSKKRDFYVELCNQNDVSIRKLQSYILNDVYEKYCFLQQHNKDLDIQIDNDFLHKILEIEQMIWHS